MPFAHWANSGGKTIVHVEQHRWSIYHQCMSVKIRGTRRHKLHTKYRGTEFIFGAQFVNQIFFHHKLVCNHKFVTCRWSMRHDVYIKPTSIMTSSNGNIFRATGLCQGNAPEPTVEQTMGTPVIWDAIVLIVTSPRPWPRKRLIKLPQLIIKTISSFYNNYLWMIKPSTP